MGEKKKLLADEIRVEVNAFTDVGHFLVMTDEEITDCVIAAIPSRSVILESIKANREQIKADLEKHGGAS